MCSSSPPPPPDYAGAAAAQGAANLETARAQGRMNNANVIGPGMSRTVTWDGDVPTVSTNLTPEEWAIYNQNVATRQQLGELGLQGATSLEGIVGKPLDLSGVAGHGGVYRAGTNPQALNTFGLPGMPNAYQGGQNLPDVQSGEATRSRVIQAMLSRSNDEIGRHEEQVKSDLIAQGLRPGTEAYAREMDAIGRQRNDAMSQAEIAGGAAAQQMFGMDSSRRAQLYGEGTTDAGLRYQQGMGIRDQALDEQGQRFGQQGQVAELGMRQQAQTSDQQNALRTRQIAELITQRQMPLNEIIGLMGGGQVNNPYAQPAQPFQGTNIAPPPIFGAHQAQNQYGMDVYNAQTGSANAQTGALAGLGGAAMIAMGF